jgi:2-alkenal reductase
MKRISILLVIAVLLLTALACNLTPSFTLPDFSLPKFNQPDFFGETAPANPSNPPSSQPVVTPRAPIVIEGVVQSEELLIALYQQVEPGVVSIKVASDIGSGQGSGFVFDTLGHIVTNYHVVEGATYLEVDFPSGVKVRGEVVGTDLDSDLAVIKVDLPEDQLHPLALGDSDALQVGQTVVAIGNPFGLSGTMTMGIVSAKGRTLESFRTTADGNAFSAGDIIQTDAAINPGNSGGPLLNLRGEVVGINRAIQTSNPTIDGSATNTGIGFAVSINIIKRVVPVLIADGHYDYPYLGISSMSEISLMEQEALGLPQSTGAYILEVVTGSPADDAGLIAGTKPTSIQGLLGGGDLITAIDGRPVRVFGDLLAYLMSNKSPGDTVVLTILRNNETKEVTVTLGKRP